MNKIEKVIKQMKSLFSSEEINFEDVKAGDKLYRVSALEVDGTIQEVPTDGTEELVDVEDGDITLDDGTVLTVVSGVITAVVKASEGEDESTDESVPETDVTMSKVFSSFEKLNFTMINQINKWQMEVDNTSFELEDIITYSYINADESVTTYTLTSGEYELEDGTKIFVDNSGKIVMRILSDGSIESISATPSEQTSSETVPTEQMSSVLIDGFSKILDEFSSMKSELTALKSEIAEFSKTPSDTPTSTKVDFKAVSGESNVKPKSVLHSMLKK